MTNFSNRVNVKFLIILASLILSSFVRSFLFFEFDKSNLYLKYITCIEEKRANVILKFGKLRKINKSTYNVSFFFFFRMDSECSIIFDEINIYRPVYIFHSIIRIRMRARVYGNTEKRRIFIVKTKILP